MQGDDLVLPPAIVLLVAWLPAELNWGLAELNWGSVESNWGSAESHWIAEVVAREVRHGVGIASILGEKSSILCVTEKKSKNINPHTGMGTPRIGMGRDMSIFQIGESPRGVHSNLGTNIHTYYTLCR